MPRPPVVGELHFSSGSGTDGERGVIYSSGVAVSKFFRGLEKRPAAINYVGFPIQ